MRTFVLFLIFSSLAAAQESVREWQSDAGKIIEAEMIEFSNDEVTLRMDGGREVTVALDKLHEVDRNYVRLQETLAQDEKQFAAVAQHLEAIRTSPMATIDILKELGKIHPKSPYGHLWAGVALGITNEPEEALKLFNEAEKRVVEQRKIDSGRHYRTLLAIYNNKAICHIKLRRPDDAAKQFMKALDLVDNLPPIIAHNTRQLYEISNQPKTNLKLDEALKKKLVAGIAKLPLEDSKKIVQPGWYFSLDMAVPVGKENPFHVIGAPPPDSTLDLIATGTGIVVAKGYVLTVAPVVTNPKRLSVLSMVAAPVGDKGRWVLRPAKEVVLESPRRELIAQYVGNSELNIKAEAGDQSASLQRVSKVTRSLYKVIDHVPGTSSAELALIKVDDLNVDPVVFASSPTTPGAPMFLSGFRRGPNMLEGGLTSERGVFQNTSDNGSSFFTTAKLAGGTRGGACVDDRFTVNGIAWGVENASSKCFSVNEIEKWIEKSVQTVEILRQNGQTPDSLKERLKKSIVPILTFGDKIETSQFLHQKFFNQDSIIDLLVVRDQYCFACNGKGAARCPQCSGVGKIQAGQGTQVVGSDARGNVLGQSVPVFQPCPTCGGRKFVDCLNCDRGRIPGGDGTERK